MELIFEWDEKKAKINIQKHNVNFEEAKTVFLNPLSKISGPEKNNQQNLIYTKINLAVIIKYSDSPNKFLK